MSSAEERRMLALAPPRATAASPAVTNTARNFGLNPAPTRVPGYVSSTRAPAPMPNLIPSQLDAQGRAGGSNRAPGSSGSGVNTNTLQGILDASGPSVTAPVTSSTGSLRPAPAPSPSQNAGAGGAGGGQAPVQTTEPAAETVSSPIDAAAALDSAINALLDPEFIGFQGDRAAELRRLQNMRNQLFGDAEFGQTGSVQRQEGLDEQSRRRLAAQRASAGMLQGGAYGGTERGLGTLQRAGQDFAMQEMQRPFREQTASDRLREFGLSFDPTNRIFDQMDMDQAGFATQTQAGREAAARARLAAIQQLAQQGIQI